jgi:hypothetical protein
MIALVTALLVPWRVFLAPSVLGRHPASADKALYVAYVLNPMSRKSGAVH